MQKPQRPPRIVRPNSLRAWWLAARPKTLSAALMPIVAASAFAFTKDSFNWLPALLCILFATLMQIAANFINDLIDFRRGTDGAERLGPERACAQGWIKPIDMRIGIALVLISACMVGLCLLPFGSLPLILIGLTCVLFAFLYTMLLSYCGFGDVLVYVFFGFVPVCGTYFVEAGDLLIRRRLRTGHRYATRLKQLSGSNNGSRSRQKYADRHFRGAFWQFVLSRPRPHRLRLSQWCFCFQRPLVSHATATLYSLPHRYVARNGRDPSRPRAE